MSLYTKPGTILPLNLSLEKTETGKYPLVTVFDTTSSVVATLSLTELDSADIPGIYSGSYTAPSTEGGYTLVYQVFTDAGHTTLDAEQDAHVAESLVVANTSGSSSGAYSHIDTIIDEDTSLPVEGVNVYIYSDSSRQSLVAGTTTNSLGVYNERLYSDAAGTYYRRIVASGREAFEDTVTFS